MDLVFRTGLVHALGQRGHGLPGNLFAEKIVQAVSDSVKAGRADNASEASAELSDEFDEGVIRLWVILPRLAEFFPSARQLVRE